MNERPDHNNSAVGEDALAFIDTLLTSEEIAERDRRVAQIGEQIKAEHLGND